MSQSRAVEAAVAQIEDLRFVLRPSERSGGDDAGVIDTERVPRIIIVLSEALRRFSQISVMTQLSPGFSCPRRAGRKVPTSQEPATASLFKISRSGGGRECGTDGGTSRTETDEGIVNR